LRSDPESPVGAVGLPLTLAGVLGYVEPLQINLRWMPGFSSTVWLIVGAFSSMAATQEASSAGRLDAGPQPGRRTIGLAMR
jgi:hypothetical protein